LKKIILILLCLLFCNGCIGTIVVATIVIKKKRAAAREALDNEINPPSDAVVTCSCCGKVTNDVQTQ
jgi:Trk-type K+ transport system membrane component